MDNPFRFADPLGPAKIVHIHVPAVGLKAIVVIDNAACGPAIGGVRMAPDVSLEECVRPQEWQPAAAPPRGRRTARPGRRNPIA